MFLGLISRGTDRVNLLGWFYLSGVVLNHKFGLGEMVQLLLSLHPFCDFQNVVMLIVDWTRGRFLLGSDLMCPIVHDLLCKKPCNECSPEGTPGETQTKSTYLATHLGVVGTIR